MLGDARCFGAYGGGEGRGHTVAAARLQLVTFNTWEEYIICCVLFRLLMLKITLNHFCHWLTKVALPGVKWFLFSFQDNAKSCRELSRCLLGREPVRWRQSSYLLNILPAKQIIVSDRLYTLDHFIWSNPVWQNNPEFVQILESPKSAWISRPEQCWKKGLDTGEHWESPGSMDVVSRNFTM